MSFRAWTQRKVRNRIHTPLYCGDPTHPSTVGSQFSLFCLLIPPSDSRYLPPSLGWEADEKRTLLRHRPLGSRSLRLLITGGRRNLLNYLIQSEVGLITFLLLASLKSILETDCVFNTSPEISVTVGKCN